MKKGKIHSTNYKNSLITIAEDSKTNQALIPPIKEGKTTIANEQYNMISSSPGKWTSDEIIFQIYAKRKDLLASEFEKEKDLFFSKGQACFRTSPLAKTYGWGIYFNEEAKVSLVACHSEEYQELINDDKVKKVPAMKSSK